MQTLTNKRVLLGVTGGIAAYKSAELVRRLQDQGADIRVVMTRGAAEFPGAGDLLVEWRVSGAGAGVYRRG